MSTELVVSGMRPTGALHLGHYYNAPRHTIQVDFGVYVHDLLKEIRRGEVRARAAGWTLPVQPRAAAQAEAMAAE